MIDEVAEVKGYIGGQNLEEANRYYRAVYMMSKYYRDNGFDREQTFYKIAEWVRTYDLTLPFSLITAVVAGYSNEKKLRSCQPVYISNEDTHRIRLYAKTRTDRYAALAILCCVKALGDSKGVITISVSALASWLGMDRANLHNRQLRRLENAGYIKRMTPTSSMRGWKKNETRNTARFKIMIPYTQDGEFELKNNDIAKLYEESFDEKLS